MKKIPATIAAGCLALSFVVLTSSAAAAAGYMKLGDIKGEATPVPGVEVELLSWSWSGSGTRAPAGLGSGRPTPITVTKTMDQASATLHRASLEKLRFVEIEFLLPQGAGQGDKFMSYSFKDAYITSYSIGPMHLEGGEQMVETIVFRAEDVSYRPARKTPKPKVKGNQ